MFYGFVFFLGLTILCLMKVFGFMITYHALIVSKNERSAQRVGGNIDAGIYAVTISAMITVTFYHFM